MTNPTWELVKIARARALTDRLEGEARARATTAGYPEGDVGHYSYALGWACHEAAVRLVRFEDAQLVPDQQAARGAAAPDRPIPQGGGAVSLDEARKSRR